MTTRARHKRTRPALTHAQCLAKLHPLVVPRLDSGQCRDLSLLHHMQLDHLANGTATTSTLYEATAGAITWLRCAQLSGLDDTPAADHIRLLASLWREHTKTGRIAPTPEQIEQIKDSTVWMDLLAKACTQPNAKRAADDSERIALQMPITTAEADMSAWVLGVLQTLLHTNH